MRRFTANELTANLVMRPAYAFDQDDVTSSAR
jgi:hypothetical protein